MVSITFKQKQQFFYKFLINRSCLVQFEQVLEAFPLSLFKVFPSFNSLYIFGSNIKQQQKYYGEMSYHVPNFIIQNASQKQNSNQKLSTVNYFSTSRERLKRKDKLTNQINHKNIKIYTQQSKNAVEGRFTSRLPPPNPKQYASKKNQYLPKDISLDFQQLLKEKTQQTVQNHFKSLEDVNPFKGQIQNEQIDSAYKKRTQEHKSSEHITNQKDLYHPIQKPPKFKQFYYPYKQKKQPRTSQDLINFKQTLKQTNDIDITQEFSDKSKLTCSGQNRKQKKIYNQQRRKTDLQIGYSSPTDIRKPKTIRKYNKEAKRMDEFIILKQLGKGNFGQVLLVLQVFTGTIYAMKIISKSYLRSQQHAENTIFRQIKIQLYLNNCYIVKLYHVFSDPQNIYMLMEAMGGSLYQKMQRKKTLNEQRAAAKLYQLIRAVDYLHQQRIIHRDLKLENIMQFERTVKIGDFGCSIHTRDLRKTKIGSFAYHSPEQLRQNFYDEKVDIWSLGIITYELLIGQGTPFDKDIFQIVQYGAKVQLSDLQFPQFPKISQQAKDFILRLLKKNPIERMSLQEALRHPFIRNNVKPYWEID